MAVLVAASPSASGTSVSPARWRLEPKQARVGFILDTFWHDVEGENSSVEASLESASGDIFLRFVPGS